MNELVSVIIPVYNVEKYLCKCLDSVLAQTYTNLEIILVDDGSPDACGQICDQYAQKDSRVKVLHKANGGVSSARNAGLDLATGKYIYFMDSDDYIQPILCQRIVELLEQHDVDIVTFDCWRVTERGKLLGGTETIDDGLIVPEVALAELMRGNINNYAWNKIYRRHIFQDIRFPEGQVWEDVAISYKLLLKARRIYCCNEKLYYYLQRPDSITGTITARALRDLFLARYQCYEDLRASYPEAAEQVFPRVALCARRLYDRSLWESVDMRVLSEAQEFLRDHRERVLGKIGGVKYRFYYRTPRLYALLRRGKHAIGSVIKRIRAKNVR